MIRKAVKEDIDTLLMIYSSAKHFMHTHGNPNQWNGAYPDRDTLVSDIENGSLFAMYDEETNEIYGVFALCAGVEPTYNVIDGGAWQSTTPYATIHRIAGNGKKHGIMKECCDFAKKTYNHLRVDTHRDNKPMQKAVLENGFSYAGIIYLANGDERLAYNLLFV